MNLIIWEYISVLLEYLPPDASAFTAKFDVSSLDAFLWIACDVNFSSPYPQNLLPSSPERSFQLDLVTKNVAT